MNRISLELRRATALSRPLPDFLIIGADESGARHLYRALCAHPASRRTDRQHGDRSSPVLDKFGVGRPATVGEERTSVR
jgi:hypothetical protein